MRRELDNLHYDFREIDGYNKPFNIVISPREPGKTTMAWNQKVYRPWQKTHKPWLYLVRNQNEIMEEETDVSLADIDCNQINKYSPFVKTNKKFILGLLLVVTIIIISFICLVFVYFSKYDSYTIVNTDIEKYQEDCKNWKRISDFLPALDSLNNHTDLFYSHKTQVSSRFMGFVGEGFALFVKYEDAVYNEKKAEILNSTTFLDAPVIDRYGDYQFPVTKFFYKSY